MILIDTRQLVALMDRVIESEEATVRHMSDDRRSTPVGRWIKEATSIIEALDYKLDKLEQELENARG